MPIELIKVKMLESQNPRFFDIPFLPSVENCQDIDIDMRHDIVF